MGSRAVDDAPGVFKPSVYVSTRQPCRREVTRIAFVSVVVERPSPYPTLYVPESQPEDIEILGGIFARLIGQDCLVNHETRGSLSAKVSWRYL